jgi:hypothetical protein
VLGYLETTVSVEFTAEKAAGGREVEEGVRAMDVLEHWRPQMDWSRFKRGQLSPHVWACFCEAVELCHAFRHWKNAEHERWRLTPAPVVKESDYARRKRNRENESRIKIYESRRMRAAFLARDRIVSITQISLADTADWSLSLALIESLGDKVIVDGIRGHERAQFEILAFDEFDADAELAAAPDAIAERWKSAGRG